MKMNVNKDKVKEFVKEHKKELIITGATMVAGGVVFVITKQKPVAPQIVETVAEKWRELDIPETSIGTISDLGTNGDWTELIVNDITVKDLGDLGNEILKIDGMNPETGVCAVVSLSNNFGK